jgi:hypothetical protein
MLIAIAQGKIDADYADLRDLRGFYGLGRRRTLTVMTSLTFSAAWFLIDADYADFTDLRGFYGFGR